MRICVTSLVKLFALTFDLLLNYHDTDPRYHFMTHFIVVNDATVHTNFLRRKYADVPSPFKENCSFMTIFLAMSNVNVNGTLNILINKLLFYFNNISRDRAVVRNYSNNKRNKFCIFYLELQKDHSWLVFVWIANFQQHIILMTRLYLLSITNISMTETRSRIISNCLQIKL